MRKNFESWCSMPRSALCSSAYQRLDLSTVHDEAYHSALQLAASPGMQREFIFIVKSVFGTIRAPITGHLSHRLHSCEA